MLKHFIIIIAVLFTFAQYVNAGFEPFLKGEWGAGSEEIISHFPTQTDQPKPSDNLSVLIFYNNINIFNGEEKFLLIDDKLISIDFYAEPLEISLELAETEVKKLMNEIKTLNNAKEVFFCKINPDINSPNTKLGFAILTDDTVFINFSIYNHESNFLNSKFFIGDRKHQNNENLLEYFQVIKDKACP